MVSITNEQLMLPGFDTKIIKYEENLYILRVNICTKEDAFKWLSDFSENTKTTYRVRNSFCDNTQKIVFKKEYRCVHNTRPTTHKVKTPHAKHTNCPAKIIITVKQQGMKRSRDPYLKNHPTEIYIKYTHNHPILAADVLRHRTPSDTVIEKFKNLFTRGHSPASALQIFKTELQEEYGEEYYQVVADGAKCPSRSWCYELYYKIFNREYGDPSGKEMIDALKKFIDNYNADYKDRCAIMSEDEEDLVVCICTPMMKRIHKYIKSSSEIMFIDSSGNMDRHNSLIFLLLCPTVVGGLPLGIIMTYSESETTIVKGLRLFLTLLDNKGFYGCYAPKIIMSDDSTAERSALKACFSDSNVLLCKFHVLQSIMRYLWDGKHKIHINDRIEIYKYFNAVLHSSTEEIFEEKVNNFTCIEIVKKYPHFLKYFTNFVKRSHEWALCFRVNLINRGNDTNNFCEAGFRILKDKILNRLKAFSIVQMFDILTTKLESYYQRKIVDCINNRLEGIQKSKYFIKVDEIKDLICSQIDESLYTVLSKDKTYIVNYADEICSCPVGSQGAPCKHQFAVIHKFNLTSTQFIPLHDINSKITLFKVLYGKSPPSNEWFANINSTLNNDLEDQTSSSTIPNVSDECSENFCNEHIEEVPIETNENLEEINKVCQKIDAISKLFKDKVLKKPALYKQPINKFYELLTQQKTDSSLVSALQTFGKYNGAGKPLINKKKNLQGGKLIGVQPTAIIRRKSKIGGRSLANTGRPSKNQRLQDHAYSKKRSYGVTDEQKTRKSAAPHSLSFCVSNNISLGKK